MAWPVPTEYQTSNQPFGSYATAGVWADPNGTEVQQLVAQYGNYQPFGHAGTDYACPVGTPLYAIADGTVLYAGWADDLPGDDSWGPDGFFQRWALMKNFAGIVTVIQHAGWISVTAHQSNNDGLVVGQQVKGGEQIGLSGNTRTRSQTVGPHVHIEALVDLSYKTSGGLIYGRTNPEPFYGLMSTLGADIINTIQEAGVALELKDLQAIQGFCNTSEARIIADNRAQLAYYADQLAQKIANSAYDIKVFSQTVMNQNGDRIIADNRAQVAALSTSIKK